MTNKVALSYVELLGLDALIAAAQAKGLGLTDRFDNTEEQAEAQAALHEAMWEARHGSFQISERDTQILAEMRDLARQLEFSPTVEQLLDLRKEALRGQR